MKKRIMVLVVLVCVIFAFAACAPQMTLEQVVSNAEKVIKESDEGKMLLSMMDMDFSVDGNTLIYKYSYKNLSSDDLDEQTLTQMQQEIENSLVEQSKVFEKDLTDIRKATGNKDVSIQLEYFTSDGELIISKEYK